MIKKLNILFELTKIKITIFVTFTTVLGYIAAKGEITAGVIIPSIGILLLACGSAAINQIQERKTDCIMDRTKNRPIPSGKISVLFAVITASLLVIAGSIILFVDSGYPSLLFGLLNLFWYNIVYTPLKKITALAIIPGAIIGAIPPVIGWISGGGELTDPRIIIIAFFFFIWQVPHFWLLLLVLSKDYQKAGFPTLTQRFSNAQLSRITFIWILSTAATCIMLPFFGLVHSRIAAFLLFVISAVLALAASKLIRGELAKKELRLAFAGINLHVIFVIIIISADKLFNLY